MKRKGVLFLAVLLMLCAGLASLFADETNPVKAIIYPLDSSIYENMDALYALCGLARPSTNRPWSDAQVRLILSKVDRSSLSGPYYLSGAVGGTVIHNYTFPIRQGLGKNAVQGLCNERSLVIAGNYY